MAENRKERDDGLYYFRRSQLAIFVTGFTLSTVVIFLLGILIGQRIEERKLLNKEEPLVKIPVPSSATGTGAAPKEELTFYDTLAKTPKGAPPTQAKPAKEAQPAAKPVAKESKPGVQVAKSPPPEKIQQKEVKPTVKEVKEVKVVAKGEAAPSAQKIKEVKEKVALAKAAPQKTPQVAPQGPWAVQVNAFPQERDAKSWAKKLVDKGYDAYVVSANIKGKTWYRVRVGRLTTREEAKALQETLKKKEKYANAITVSR